MEFYLTNIKSGDRLRIPIAPDRISVKKGALTQSFTIINKGETKIPRGTSLTGYSWNGVFPSEQRNAYSFVHEWQRPAAIVSLLTGWMEAGDTIRLMITELSINADVFIESFTYDYFGIGDCSYTLSLALRRELTISTVSAPPITVVPSGSKPDSSNVQYGTVTTSGGPLNVRAEASVESKLLDTIPNGARVEVLGKTGNWYIISHEAGEDGMAYVHASYIVLDGANSGTTASPNSGENKTSTSTGSLSNGGSYTVKSGDSLFSIALSMLGDGSRYTEIYTLNQSAIDAANKGKGVSKYTIYAGMTLKLPEKKSVTVTTKSVSGLVSAAADKVKSVISSAVTAAKSVVTTKPTATVTNVAASAVKKAFKQVSMK